MMSNFVGSCHSGAGVKGREETNRLDSYAYSPDVESSLEPAIHVLSWV